MIKVLHITAHLGGGVGRVVSGVVRESKERRDGVLHSVVSLEAPKNSQFASQLSDSGAELYLCPNRQELLGLITQADIVQLEWWHHPVLAEVMCAGELPPSRWIVWSHVSGLHPPVIPPSFLMAPHRFLFTSPCSWEHPDLSSLKQQVQNRVDVVFSAGGFGDLVMPVERSYRRPLRVGYVGTLNYAKLNPRILDYVASVRLADFRLTMVGDLSGAHELAAEAGEMGLSERLEFRGYRTNVAVELAGFDVMAYLLNPVHYGTTENALLEAMAMGVVPVVLDNPAERYLVKHNETGLIVTNPDSFAGALDWLAAYPDEVRRMSTNCVLDARKRFTLTQTVERLNRHYRLLMKEDKCGIDFRRIFGDDPADWFLACQGAESWRFSDVEPPAKSLADGPHFLFEATKASVFHYRDTFPGNSRLERWARRLENARSAHPKDITGSELMTFATRPI